MTTGDGRLCKSATASNWVWFLVLHHVDGDRGNLINNIIL